MVWQKQQKDIYGNIKILQHKKKITKLIIVIIMFILVKLIILISLIIILIKMVILSYFSPKEKQFQLHRLIGKYFNDDKYVINHIDKNKSNNNIDNLEWITYKDNTIHNIGKKIAKIDVDTDNVIKIYNNWSI